jgi:hypothetical protein
VETYQVLAAGLPAYIIMTLQPYIQRINDLLLSSDAGRKARILTLWVFLLVLPPNRVEAQIGASDDFVFDDSAVPHVTITLDQAHLDDLFAPGNQYSDEERPATFAFIRGLDTMRVDSIGFRFRGNTSRDSQKKSFKVSFNTFRRGQKFLGLEKLNINGEHNDPSIMRSKIGWDLFRSMGIPASRSNHVRLYVNDEYYGLYVNVEHVDEQFLQRHFENDQGNLYKCLWPADMTWLGPDGSAYRPLGDDRRPYDLKLKDSDLEGYDDLAHFIDVVNNTGPADFREALEGAFNVNGFLRVLAVTTITGSWDSYWFLKNHYYLYAHPETGLFEFIPYDFDNIMGIWWEGIYPGLDWGTRDVYEWGHPDAAEARPLVDRILAVPEYRDRYTLYLRMLLAGPFEESVLQSRIMSLRSLVESAAVDDTYRTRDYGYTIQDFYDSYTTSLDGHVTQGLLPFVAERIRSASSQLDAVDVRPVLSSLRVSPEAARPGTNLTVSVRVEDEDPAPEVLLHVHTGSTQDQIVPMFRRSALGVDVYAATISAPSEPSLITVYVTASDPAGQMSATDARSISVLDEVAVVINEVMSANASSNGDEAGEFDDWLELYNPGPEEVSLDGFTLTDDPARPSKWTFPDTTIGIGGYVLVWADEDGSQGPMHANFRLSRLGEFLGLFDPAGAPIDALEVPAQADDVSYGRIPDGGHVWGTQGSATPGGPNSGSVSLEDTFTDAIPSLSVYPNPFRSRLNIAVAGAQGGRFEVFDLLGRRIVVYRTEERAKPYLEWDGRTAYGDPVPAGVYLIRYIDRIGKTRHATAVRLHRSAP